MKNIAKQPWHVYKGGNFTCVVTEGYEEWVEKHGDIAGPFLVCQIDPEDNDTRPMRQCQKIAAQICAEHNYALKRTQTINKQIYTLVKLNKKFPGSFAA